MKRKISDLSLADQKYTRTLLMKAANTAHQQGTLSEFLEGLLTPSEQIMLGRRVWIARLLMEGKSYDEIGSRLHVGMSTVGKIEAWLQGIMPDYGAVIAKALKQETVQNRKRVAAQNPFGLTALKMKYPLHFLLFPWPKN